MSDRFSELKDLVPVVCDNCMRLREDAETEINCKIFGKPCVAFAEMLLDHEYRRSCVVVSEAFKKLVEMMEETVIDLNVDYFSEVKCYMTIIENDYIKKCWSSSGKECNSNDQSSRSCR